MKIDKKVVVVVIIIALLLLIGYLTYPFVVEGLASSSIDTQVAILQKQLSQDKYKDPSDIVVIGQKINLLTQGTTLLTKVLADPTLKKENKKKNYQKVLAEWQTQVEPLKKKHKELKAAQDYSMKSKR